MAISSQTTSRLSTLGWRTPAVIVLCGCLISLLSFGPRATLGFFLTPMSQANGWDRDVFGLAIAIQNIIWGAGQPLAGAIADRFGTIRVLCAGGLVYAIGLTLMAYSTTPGMLDLAAGVLIGFGLAGSSFAVVLGAFGKLLPESWRLLAFGAGTAALLTDDDELEDRLAIPMGAGMGLTFDEAALLLDLRDVYWTREGLLSVQLSLGATAILSIAILTQRMLRHGEQRQEEAGEIPLPATD